jgi:hypothetical protein
MTIAKKDSNGNALCPAFSPSHQQPFGLRHKKTLAGSC